MICPFCGKKYLYSAQGTADITFHCPKCNNDSIIVKSNDKQKKIFRLIPAALIVPLAGLILRVFHVDSNSAASLTILILAFFVFLILLVRFNEGEARLEKKSIDPKIIGKT